MEEGVRPISRLKTTQLSLQIIITILTIIKLYINFNEINYDDIIFLIVDNVVDFIILIVVIITPIFNSKLKYLMYILGFCFFLMFLHWFIVNFQFCFK